MTRLPAPRDSDIAVIGLACRFPGSDGVEAFWSSLSASIDSITEVPHGRWRRTDRRDDAAPVDLGGFIDAIDGIDASFFGISDSEAATMCPQQRLLLEAAWHALEHAGIMPKSLSGTDTGVFVGLCGHDFSIQHWLSHDNLYLGTGTSNSVAANRISFLLGTHGPSFAIDSACSSGLVSVHLACRALRDGECTLALTGSSNVLLLPQVTASLGRSGLIARDGRCHSFGDGASGYVRSEGVGMLVLKRLDDARRDNDDVLAIISGSAINHNGCSNGLTAPNPVAQARLFQRALAEAALPPSAVGYIEAAATGTRLGDAIEIKAIKDVYVTDIERAAPLVVGSVKTNIGHLEGAGGIAALIKAVLTLHHGGIPASLHSERLNPLCRIDPSALRVPQRVTEWHAPAGERVAAVSSFGFGGANAHVIVRDLPPVRVDAEALPASGVSVLPLSAHCPPALSTLRQRYAERIAADPALDLHALAASAARHRQPLPCRAAHVFSDRDELLSALRAPLPTPVAAGAFALRLAGRLVDRLPHLARLYCDDRNFVRCVDAIDAALTGRLRVAVADRMSAVNVDAEDDPLLPIALDLALLIWLDERLTTRVALVADGDGQLAAAVVRMQLPLSAAADIATSTFDWRPWQPRLAGRHAIHAAQADRRLPAAWASQMQPAPGTLAIIDPAAFDVAPERFAVELLAALWRQGMAPDWRGWHPNGRYRRLALPHYPFQRTRHWPTPPQAEHNDAGHPLLHSAHLTASSGGRFTARLDARALDWLADYRIDGTVVLSAAAQLGMAIDAVRLIRPSANAITLHDCAFAEPLLLPRDVASRIAIALDPIEADRLHCRIVDTESPLERLLFECRVELVAGTLPGVATEHSWTALPDGFYNALAAHGYHYGPSHRGLRQHNDAPSPRHFTLHVPTADVGLRSVHPGLVDAGFHALLQAAEQPLASDDLIRVPHRIARAQAALADRPCTDALLCIAGATPTLRYADRCGRCWLQLEGVAFAELPRAALAALSVRPAQPGEATASADADPLDVIGVLLGRVIGTSYRSEHAQVPLTALGVDSLKAMDLRGHLRRAFAIDVGIATLLGGATAESLAKLLAERCSATSHSPSPTTPTADLDVVRLDASEEQPVEIEL